MRFGIRELLFVGAIVGLLVCSYFVLQKKTLERQAIEADTAAKQRALSELHLSTAGIDDLNVRINELQQVINDFDQMLPRQKEVDTILKDICKKADANSLQTRTIKTMRVEGFAGYSEQPIQVSLSGDFNGFYLFLLELEKLKRVTRLTQMNLQKIQERDGEMQAQMTLSIFFTPDGGPKVARVE